VLHIRQSGLSGHVFEKTDTKAEGWVGVDTFLCGLKAGINHTFHELFVIPALPNALRIPIRTLYLSENIQSRSYDYSNEG
jgi:hypothetical protein